MSWEAVEALLDARGAGGAFRGHAVPVLAKRRGLSLFELFLLTLLMVGCGRIDFEVDPALDGIDGGMDASTPVEDAGALDPACGDGELAGAEVCDDGNTASGDGCRGDCAKRELCGDGHLDEGEACDDGNADPEDGCRNDCSPSCVAAADCDDANPCNGAEACTDGACAAGTPLDPGAICDPDRVCRAGLCASTDCGNAAVEPGEDCDDANLEADDGCEADCTFTCETDAECSDGEWCNGEERCELATHTCAAAGPRPVPGTLCERDGDAATRDLCLGEVCVRSLCGDGFVDSDGEEDCDDDNVINGDGCDNDCRFSCTTDVECPDDGDPCNGLEQCDDAALHRCVAPGASRPGSVCMVADRVGVCVSGRCISIADAGPSPIDGGPSPIDAGPPDEDAGTACPTPPTTSSPVECFQGCENSADCVYVQSSCCCSCSSGGTSEAINGAYESIWVQRRMDSCGLCPVDLLCPSIFNCPLGSPSCVDGRCVGGGAS